MEIVFAGVSKGNWYFEVRRIQIYLFCLAFSTLLKKHDIRFQLTATEKGILICVNLVFIMLEVWWPCGYCPRLWSEWSRSKLWPGTLCCVSGETLYSHDGSPHPGV